MTHSCPHCGHGVTYNVELAGKTAKCPNCQKPILMPPLNNLPPQYKQEYLDEQEEKAYLAEQALIRRKEEETIRKQHQEQLEMATRRQNEIEKETPKQKIVKGKRPTAEDGARSNYPWLSILASVYNVAGLIGLLGCIFFLIGIIIVSCHGPGMKDIGEAFVYCFYLGLASLTCIAMGELIHLIINMANDLNGAKALLKRVAYPNEDAHAQQPK
jgi:hypothetical protein